MPEHKSQTQRQHPLELRVPPPVVALVCALCMLAFYYFVSGFNLQASNYANSWLNSLLENRIAIAVSLVLLGFLIALAGVLRFKKQDTTIHPLKPEEASSLVTTGIYQYTRNPMYLGMAIALSGIAWAIPNYLNILCIIAFVAYITRFQIKPEERILEAKFGEAYTAYKNKVRRWL